MPDPSRMFTTIAAMSAGGFNKADVSNLARVYADLAWRLSGGDGQIRDYFAEGARWLRALDRQETRLVFFVGLPERA